MSMQLRRTARTALVIATIRRQLSYAEFLLNQGADPNLGPGFTPLHWAAGKWDTELNDLSNGVAEGNQWSAFGGLRDPDRLQTVKLLLANGADPNARTERTPGFGIRVKGHLGNITGGTAFLIAARANDLAVMRELLAHGARSPDSYQERYDTAHDGSGRRPRTWHHPIDGERGNGGGLPFS